MLTRTIFPICALIGGAGLAHAAEPAGHALRTRQLLETASPERKVTIVAFGDSITGKYYHTGGLRAWPELLELLLRRQYPHADLSIRNAGCSGHTAEAGLKRIQNDVLDLKPDLVIVAFGMNDAGYGEAAPAKDTAQKKRFRENLTKITEQCRGLGTEVILCTPTNVYPEAAPRRPPERLAEFADIVRDLGVTLGAPVADSYAAYDQMLKDKPADWRLLMSETIHPNLNGHKLIAETVAGVVTGKKATVGDLPPPSVTGPLLSGAQEHGRPVKVVAMQPCTEAVNRAFREVLPNAKLELTSWPTDERTLDQLVDWAQGIRKQTPALVVITFPSHVLAFDDEEHFVRQASWVVNWSLPFGNRRWDVLCLAPSLPPDPSPTQRRAVALLHGLATGHDIAWIDGKAGLQAWLDQQLSR